MREPKALRLRRAPGRAPLPLALIVALFAAAPGCASAPEKPEPLLLPRGDEPRLQLLTSFARQSDLEKPGFLEELLLGKPPEVGLGKPYGIAGGGGNLYVCDMASSCLWKVDLAAQRIERFTPGPGARLEGPVNASFAVDGTLAVADPGSGTAVLFDREGKLERAFGDKKLAMKPFDVVATAKEVFVLDGPANDLKVFDRKSGALLRKIGGPGSDPGWFYKPTNLALGPDGSIYVSDSFNFRIQRFSPDGKLIATLGKAGRSRGTFSRLKGIAVDRDKRLYAVDAAFQNVQIFDEQGRTLLSFGDPSQGVGQLNLPAKVSIDYEDAHLFASEAAPGYEFEYLILITSQFGPNKVTVYGFLRKKAVES